MNWNDFADKSLLLCAGLAFLAFLSFGVTQCSELQKDSNERLAVCVEKLQKPLECSAALAR